VQQPISALVTDFRKAFPQAQLLTSGFIFHAAAGTTLAKKEMNTVGTGSLLAIVILVLAVFRTRQALLAILLTLTSAVVVALAASLAVFGQIHLLTLAFGSTLLGLAVDYCFHFLLTYRRTGTALRAGRAIGRGLLLSVFSSVAAYSLQLISPFPGLQQFAVFVSSGLLGAAAFIGLLTLCYKEPAARPLCPGLFERTIGPRYPQLSRHTGLVYLVVIGLIAGSAWTIHNAGTNDDLRQLNTSGSDLLASEQQVQALIGGLDSQRYWVIRGDDSQQVLSRTAEFMASLQNPAMAITQLVPPLVQQQYDYRLIRTKLYGSEGALKQLCLRLQQPCSTWLEQQRPFIAGLIPAHLPNDFTRYFPTLATGNDHQRLVFPFLDQSPGEATPAARFSADWLHYVDKVRNISDTLTGFRLQVSQLVAGFLALFSLAAFALYRWRGVALVACVVTSLSVALALSATAGITLFHILALLLVMGIALDTAIFYLELGLTAHTWGAATLSTLTSVLAFGLLSLSQVPVLNQFGSVVFIGLLCTWLLAPILYCTSSAETCGFKE
jgi:predicted exporter